MTDPTEYVLVPREALEAFRTLVGKLQNCRMIPRQGVSGQTIDAQMRASYIKDVPGSWVVDAQHALDDIDEALLSAAPPPPAREAGLREALVEAEDTLRLVEKPAIEDPMHQAAIEQLGDRIGYGALMRGAQAAWRKRLGAQAGGEFVAGPCYATVLSALAKIRAVLSQQQETGW